MRTEQERREELVARSYHKKEKSLVALGSSGIGVSSIAAVVEFFNHNVIKGGFYTFLTAVLLQATLDSNRKRRIARTYLNNNHKQDGSS
jgi:hypothetical protein